MQAQPFLQQQGPVTDQYRLRGLIEQLTQQLLKLDSVQSGSEVRAARKAQIGRIEALADRLECLKQG